MADPGMLDRLRAKHAAVEAAAAKKKEEVLQQRAQQVALNLLNAMDQKIHDEEEWLNERVVNQELAHMDVLHVAVYSDDHGDAVAVLDRAATIVKRELKQKKSAFDVECDESGSGRLQVYITARGVAKKLNKDVQQERDYMTKAHQACLTRAQLWSGPPEEGRAWSDKSVFQVFK